MNKYDKKHDIGHVGGPEYFRKRVWYEQRLKFSLCGLNPRSKYRCALSCIKDFCLYSMCSGTLSWMDIS